MEDSPDYGDAGSPDRGFRDAENQENGNRDGGMYSLSCTAESGGKKKTVRS